MVSFWLRYHTSDPHCDLRDLVRDVFCNAQAIFSYIGLRKLLRPVINSHFPLRREVIQTSRPHVRVHTSTDTLAATLHMTLC